MTEEPFWRRKSLEEMSTEEWESLCDGCGNCCRVKLQIPPPRRIGRGPVSRGGRSKVQVSGVQAGAGAEIGEIVETDVTCRLLDLESCRCTDYANRQVRVPGCLRLTPEAARTLSWLPETCAYRRVARGQDLHWWHPLVSGDPETVHTAGVSVRGRCTSEREVDDLDRLADEWIEWVEE